MVKEIRMKLKLDYEPEVFIIAEEHFILRFQSVVDCGVVLKGGPWFVARQLLAMEAWKPNFVPRRKVIMKTVVWLWLPGLPMKFWKPSTILAIAAKAGKLLATEDFTDLLRKIGYAQIYISGDRLR